MDYLSSLISLALTVLIIVSMWKIYVKAGEPGWAAIIPIYNLVILLKIIGKEWYMLFLLLIPIANIVFAIMWVNALSKAFGKSAGYTAGMIFLPFIFMPMLAFGSAQYTKPAPVQK